METAGQGTHLSYGYHPKRTKQEKTKTKIKPGNVNIMTFAVVNLLHLWLTYVLCPQSCGSGT